MLYSHIVVPHNEVDATVRDQKVIAAISISGTHHRMPTPASLRAPIDVLTLEFDDDGLFGGRQAAMRILSQEWMGNHFPDLLRENSKSGWVSVDIVRSVLEFGRKYKAHYSPPPRSGERPEGIVLAHCFAGHSRSPAVTLACLAQGYGMGQELAAVDALLGPVGMSNFGPRPSPLFVLTADWLLGRRGALVRACRERGIW